MTRATRRVYAALILLSLAVPGSRSAQQPLPLPGSIREIPLVWPGKSSVGASANVNQASPAMGSTHEITWNCPNGKALWISGQNYDCLARVTLDGTVTFFPLPPGSGPHGLAFDGQGHLWVSLEFSGAVVRLDANGKIVQRIDVRLHAKGAKTSINTHPHALALGPDGKTLWFTGKKTGTVGRINPDGSVEHFELPTVGSVPIYLLAGPDGNVYCTELVGNKIARITSKGEVRELSIPTNNSRPIALVRGPDNKHLWFSEEAGSNVGRLDVTSGVITEFPVPRTQNNSLLAALTFDDAGNLWTQAYDAIGVSALDGPDYLVKLDKSIVNAMVNAGAGDLSRVPVTYYETPSRRTILHRILAGPDGNLWFTEMGLDRLGMLVRPNGNTHSVASIKKRRARATVMRASMRGRQRPQKAP